jgi:hypothetical protein
MRIMTIPIRLLTIRITLLNAGHIGRLLVRPREIAECQHKAKSVGWAKKRTAIVQYDLRSRRFGGAQVWKDSIVIENSSRLSRANSLAR